MIHISIIIPTYNRPANLTIGLQMLYKQIDDDPSVEIIVVDDGSTSEFRNQIQMECEQVRAKLILHDTNHGMAVARNSGINASSGEWIIFMDDDVVCNHGWYTALTQAVHDFPDTVAGFEGRIYPSGSGVWDKEVQNINGGACLTSHLGVRRTIIEQCGPFDPEFEYIGPYCEDHEFAVRLKKYGDILFLAECAVTHTPRHVHLLKYIWNAPRRCRELLRADRYFFLKQPDGYHHFRSHHSFSGTYFSYCFRHVINVLFRRSFIMLCRHPIQSGVLIIAACIEQITAWSLLPEMRGTYRFHK